MLTPRQSEIQAVIVRVFSGCMPAIAGNYRRVADAVGLRNSGDVLTELQAMRAKGVILSAGGPSRALPERWVVATHGGVQ